LSTKSKISVTKTMYVHFFLRDILSLSPPVQSPPSSALGAGLLLSGECQGRRGGCILLSPSPLCLDFGPFKACPLFIEGKEVREPLTLIPFAPLFPKSRKSVCLPQYPKLMKK
jgi:hypothetical protein